MSSAPTVEVATHFEVQVERALHVSDFPAARRLAEEACQCAADDRSRALADFLVARCDFVSGNSEDGARRAREAATLFESLGDHAWNARARALAARCLVKAGDGGAALENGLEALKWATQAQPTRPSPALLAALLALGIVYRRMGQFDTARDYCQQAVDVAIAVSDRVTQGAAIDTLACLHSSVAAVARKNGHREEAERHEREAMRCSSQAIQIAREQGHLRYEATAVNNLAESMSHVGEAPAALQMLEDWTRDNPCELQRVRVTLLETRGRLCQALGQTQRARELFELALAAGPDADKELNIVSCLAAACETLGDFRAAFQHLQRFHALHVQFAAEAAQRSARIAAVRLDTQRQRERALELELHNTKLQQRADALLRQSTDLLLANDQLNRRVTAALESMSDAVLISDAQGAVVNFNEAFATFHRFQDKSNCARAFVEHPDFLDVCLLNGDRVPEANLAVPRALRGESANHVEFTLRRRDTGQSWIGSYSYAPIRDKDGSIVGAVVTARDVTDIKQAEGALTQAKEAAEAANRAKSTFLATMSHELRTPLNGIMGMIELAKRRAHDPRQVDHLAKATKASQHLLEIIRDILDISRIEANRFALREAEFRLGSIFQNLEAMIQHQSAGKLLEFSVQPSPELPGMVVNGDARRLSQVLLNLVGNAVKFTAKGSITVRAMPLADTLTALVLRFEVEDTGIGIAPQDQQRIFEAFEQFDSSPTRAYGGSGLGLAISRRLVNMMGGEIGVDSQLGAGATFWFTVRLGKAGLDAGWRSGVGADTTPRALLQARHAGAHVLLADDDALNLEVAQGLLEECGLIAHCVDDGAQAVERARHFKYDLILMDVQMPVLDGVEATREIRRQHHNPDVPVIAFTANVFPEDEERCRAAGMNDFVGRPVEAKELYATLLAWLDRRRNAMGAGPDVAGG
jgi:signal transduction histidine kinase/tetratricopeptide (TPR) repeat protein/ActR/RegA family two-component response regulator